MAPGARPLVLSRHGRVCSSRELGPDVRHKRSRGIARTRLVTDLIEGSSHPLEMAKGEAGTVHDAECTASTLSDEANRPGRLRPSLG